LSKPTSAKMQYHNTFNMSHQSKHMTILFQFHVKKIPIGPK
jgi:hypothetical protein